MEATNISVEEISPPNVTDVIDLTKESPRSGRPSRRQRNVEISSSCDTTGGSNHRTRVAVQVTTILPMVLGNTQDTQTTNPRKKKKVSHKYVTSSNEILILDDTIEEDNTCYTVQSDDKKSVPLTCPICFESLSSNRKPITTRCGHLFCIECLQTCIRTSKKCPTCQSAITLKSCTRLYI